MASDRQSDDRTAVLRDLLIEQVARSTIDPVHRRAASRHLSASARTIWVTGVVLVIVVAVSALVLRGGLSSAPPVGGSLPTSSATAASTAVPAPGQVLATMSSADGVRQTRVVSPNGMSLVVMSSCSGGGSLSISVPHDFDSGEGCEGLSKSSSGGGNKGTAGSVPVHVRASSPKTKWTITITVSKPTYITPTPMPSPTASDGAPAPYCTDADLVASYRTVQGRDERTAPAGEIAFTNGGSGPCTLYGAPRIQFLDHSGDLIGRHANARTDQKGLAFKGVLPVTLEPGGHAYVELDYYDLAFYTDNPENGPCTPEAVTALRVDLSNALAGADQHGTLTVTTPSVEACKQPVLQLFNTDFVSYRMKEGQ